MKNNPKYFVIDVDGTFTTGQTLVYKTPSDNRLLFSSSKIFDKNCWAGIEEICEKIHVICVGDGSSIDESTFNYYFTHSMPSYLWGSHKKVTTKWAYEHTNKHDFIRDLGLENVIYFSNSWFDIQILKDSYLGIVPGGCRTELMRAANIVLQSKPGNGCVLDACIAVKHHLDYQD